MTHTTAGQARTLIDRADTEATLWRVAICSFTYYPDKETNEPGYTVDEDLAWCTTPLAGLPNEQLAALGDSIRALITDPAEDRRTFIATLASLTE